MPGRIGKAGFELVQSVALINIRESCWNFRGGVLHTEQDHSIYYSVLVQRGRSSRVLCGVMARGQRGFRFRFRFLVLFKGETEKEREGKSKGI